MTRVLLVDDDPLLLQLYRAGLEQHGFALQTAGDGLTAIQALRHGAPELMVLDLMMPKFTGVDVLRFVRSQPALAKLPVVVLSNSYMDELGRQAAELGASKALLKISCSPLNLAAIIREILSGRPTSEDPSQLLAVPQSQPALPPAPSPAAPPPQRPAVSTRPQPQPRPSSAEPAQSAEDEAAEREFQAMARADFLDHASETCANLRSLCRSFATAKNDSERGVRLQDLYRKVHFNTATAGLAGCHHVAHMSSAFEALLFEALAKPAFISPSMVRTIATTVDFLAVLFSHAREACENQPVSGHVLVVDDDPLSNRLVVAALVHAHLLPRATEDPQIALRWATEKPYDLVLLDIEMPGIDGFDLCKRLRTMPNYRNTPVIFVTSHGDFESRAKSLFSGGDDLIAKPVFPLELAVKAVAHLLRKQLPEAAAPA